HLPRSPLFPYTTLFRSLLLVTTMNLTSMAVVREKEIGTLEQIMVTPIQPTELIIGKLIPFTIIGTINATVVLLVMIFGFGIPIKDRKSTRLNSSHVSIS